MRPESLVAKHVVANNFCDAIAKIEGDLIDALQFQILRPETCSQSLSQCKCKTVANPLQTDKREKIYIFYFAISS